MGWVWLAIVLPMAGAATHGAYRSHPTMRALPAPSERPLANGPTRFVDPVKGDDRHDGSQGRPWQSLGHSVQQLAPGDTLYLRGGTYYEPVTLTASGTAEKPITIGSFPGELAVIDGGQREFAENPSKAWQPFRGGAQGEYRSTKVYPGLGDVVMGNFGDSMVPLHGYRNLIDLRSDNGYWNLGQKFSVENGFYCGPGFWYDASTGYLHVRLAHTSLEILGDNNYRGETDPRKLPLIVAGNQTPLQIEGAACVNIRDLVLRGGSGATVRIVRSQAVELDGLTVYGGSPALWVQGTQRLRIVNSALRGISAPWSTRAGQKYRGSAAYLLWSASEAPQNREFEIAHSEFTDSHDGLFIGTIQGLRLHHNLVDNFNDDGVYLTADGVGGEICIYQNRLSRCLTTFSFYGEHAPGTGVHIYRNVIDLRSPVHYIWPKGPDDPLFRPTAAGAKPRFPSAGRLCGDHGGPIWEPIAFYHNTVIARDAAFRHYYGAGWGGHVNSKRSVFNNIFVQIEGNPGLSFATKDDTLLAVDANLLWGSQNGPAAAGDFFAGFRKSLKFQASKNHYPPGWGASDRFADPGFVRFGEDDSAPFDLRLRPESAAVDGGIELSTAWPDPLRGKDRGKPDLGAFPLGAEPLQVGRASASIAK